MNDLAAKNCVPCRGGVPPLAAAEQVRLQGELHADWHVVQGHHLERIVVCADFATGLAFVNRVGALAEQQGHHPDLLLRWGEVRITVWTHAIDGLTESDFVLAAKIDALTP